MLQLRDSLAGSPCYRVEYAGYHAELLASLLLAVAVAERDVHEIGKKLLLRLGRARPVGTGRFHHVGVELQRRLVEESRERAVRPLHAGDALRRDGLPAGELHAVLDRAEVLGHVALESVHAVDVPAVLLEVLEVRMVLYLGRERVGCGLPEERLGRLDCGLRRLYRVRAQVLAALYAHHRHVEHGACQDGRGADELRPRQRRVAAGVLAFQLFAVLQYLPPRRVALLRRLERLLAFERRTLRLGRDSRPALRPGVGGSVVRRHLVPAVELPLPRVEPLLQLAGDFGVRAIGIKRLLERLEFLVELVQLVAHRVEPGILQLLRPLSVEVVRSALRLCVRELLLAHGYALREDVHRAHHALVVLLRGVARQLGYAVLEFLVAILQCLRFVVELKLRPLLRLVGLPRLYVGKNLLVVLDLVLETALVGVERRLQLLLVALAAYALLAYHPVADAAQRPCRGGVLVTVDAGLRRELARRDDVLYLLLHEHLRVEVAERLGHLVLRRLHEVAHARLHLTDVPQGRVHALGEYVVENELRHLRAVRLAVREPLAVHEVVRLYRAYPLLSVREPVESSARAVLPVVANLREGLGVVALDLLGRKLPLALLDAVLLAGEAYLRQRVELGDDVVHCEVVVLLLRVAEGLEQELRLRLLGLRERRALALGAGDHVVREVPRLVDCELARATRATPFRTGLFVDALRTVKPLEQLVHLDVGLDRHRLVAVRVLLRLESGEVVVLALHLCDELPERDLIDRVHGVGRLFEPLHHALHLVGVVRHRRALAVQRVERHLRALGKLVEAVFRTPFVHRRVGVAEYLLGGRRLDAERALLQRLYGGEQQTLHGLRRAVRHDVLGALLEVPRLGVPHLLGAHPARRAHGMRRDHRTLRRSRLPYALDAHDFGSHVRLSRNLLVGRTRRDALRDLVLGCVAHRRVREREQVGGPSP